jgi:hypothetical protein
MKTSRRAFITTSASAGAGLVLPATAQENPPALPKTRQKLGMSTYHYSDILSDFHFFSSFIRRFRWDW